MHMDAIKHSHILSLVGKIKTATKKNSPCTRGTYTIISGKNKNGIKEEQPPH